MEPQITWNVGCWFEGAEPERKGWVILSCLISYAMLNFILETVLVVCLW